MARKRKKSEMRAGELNLTAMIDVAFQLLSFFIITVRPVDVITQLDVFRPSADTVKKDTQRPPPVIKIMIFPEGYSINDRPVELQDLDRLLTKLAGLDKTQTILIMCASQSPHGRLVDVLDLCAKSGLINLSVVSAG
jgi:biopolymer transport protein ExbD